MNLAFDIAKRYLLGKKSTSAINIISWISIVGLTIGTAALILILSVFNGFETLLSGLYNSFNPDLKVIPAEGKYFSIPTDTLQLVSQIPGVSLVSKTIEEVALFEYKETQKTGKIKGVDGNFQHVTSMSDNIEIGSFKLKEGSTIKGVIGKGMSTNLSINYKDQLTPIKVYMPIRKNSSMMSQMGKEFTNMNVYPAGVFSVRSDADVNFIISDFDAVNDLLGLEDKVSFLELRLTEGADEISVRQGLKSIIGGKYIVKNKFEQDEGFLKVMNIEKWVGFLITALILAIISFNLVGSLWMMVLEKKKDISILRSMGYDSKHIRRIFMMEGLIITMIGIIMGIVLALLLYFLQKQFGLVSVPDGFMISAYPIDLKWQDFVVVIITVMGIGFLASLLPSYRAGQVSAFVRQEAGL